MNITPNLIVETVLYTPLISRLGTLKPKRHRHIAEGSKWSDESCLRLVLNCHLDLMITRVSIQKTQTLTTRRSINDLINTRESKRVSRTSFAQICVIHTHVPGAILFKHKHRVSQPLWVKNFNNEPGRQVPGHLLSDSLAPFLVKPPKKLPDQLKLWINIESVLSKFSRYTRHVRRLPCKDVPVLMDELDERAFLFWIQVSTDNELFG